MFHVKQQRVSEQCGRTLLSAPKALSRESRSLGASATSVSGCSSYGEPETVTDLCLTRLSGALGSGA